MFDFLRRRRDEDDRGTEDAAIEPSDEPIEGMPDEAPAADEDLAAQEALPGATSGERAGSAPGVDDAEAVRTDAEELAAGLARSRGGFMSRLRGFLGLADTDPAIWDDIEEALIAGDVGPSLASGVVERARTRRDAATAESAVRAELAALLAPRDPDWDLRPAVPGRPAIILVVGVNGTGKTTTIGKLAWRETRAGRKVVLAAADTFRAAAIDQLRIWGERAGAAVVAHAPGADPGAVVFDALDAAIARGADTVIADTAGRLHTKSHLMDELSKIRRVIDRRVPDAHPETLFVLDATTGQNGLAQARAFHDAVGLTGLVLTKLDSTARGGIVFAIEQDLGVPVRFVGVGERAEDLVAFDPTSFVAALFDEATSG